MVSLVSTPCMMFTDHMSVTVATLGSRQAPTMLMLLSRNTLKESPNPP